jgi:hypothetical protein
MTDSDLKAILAFLRTQKPVKKNVMESLAKFAKKD